MKLIIAISGASGVIYGIKFLKECKSKNIKTHLIISENAKDLISYETDYKIEQLKKFSSFYYENNNLNAKISSGSFKFDAMVIIPCSLSTLSKITVGISDNLITRTASVCLKERRKLVIVPRETPLSTIYLENMAKLSREAIILPAMPGFYSKPKSIDDLVDFIVGKVFDVLGVENKLYKRWGE